MRNIFFCILRKRNHRFGGGAAGGPWIQESKLFLTKIQDPRIIFWKIQIQWKSHKSYKIQNPTNFRAKIQDPIIFFSKSRIQDKIYQKSKSNRFLKIQNSIDVFFRIHDPSIKNQYPRGSPLSGTCVVVIRKRKHILKKITKKCLVQYGKTQLFC